MAFDPNLFIHLGDNIYADIKDPNTYFGKKRNAGPFKNTPRFWPITPEEMKIKYDIAKYGQPGYVALRKKTQVLISLLSDLPLLLFSVLRAVREKIADWEVLREGHFAHRRL